MTTFDPTNAGPRPLRRQAPRRPPAGRLAPPRRPTRRPTRAELRVPSPQRRSVWLLAAVCLAVFVLIVMLVRLQVVEPGRYVEKGLNQRQVTTRLVGLRGSILDRNGEPLAMSLPARAVEADPRHIPDPSAEAAKLAPVLNLDPDVVLADLQRPDTGFVYVARQLDPAIGAKVTALNLPGIYVSDESRRVTAADDLGSAVVGRMDSFGELATYGLEASLNKQLTGHDGTKRIERGAGGATIVGSESIVKAPAAGQDVTLTLDRSMQFFAETALEQQVAAVGGASGTVIVGRPATGEVLAMASVVSTKQPDGTSIVHPSQLNLAVRTYEPGSVMKIVTASAAFEHNVVQLDTTLTVPDKIQVGPKYVVHDAETHKTTDMSVAQIIAQSSNVGTIKIAQRVGQTALLKELDAFGFGKITNLGLDKEQAGQFRRSWNQSDIGSIPIGQSITATPLQIWSAYNAVANRGTYVAPKLIDKWTDPTGKIVRPAAPTPHRIMSPDAAVKVTQALEQVIEDGTGKQFSIPGYNIAAKTGTALEPLPGGGYGSNGNRHYDASFAGFFPATDPQLSIIVMIDNPQAPNNFGATAAGPVFDRLAKEAMRRYGIAGDAVDPGTPGKPTHAQPAQAPTTTTTTLVPATTTVPVPPGGTAAAPATPQTPVTGTTSPPDATVSPPGD